MKYHVYQVQRGKARLQWRWRLVASNGKVVASGESYHNRQDCLEAIDLVKASGRAEIVDLTRLQA